MLQAQYISRPLYFLRPAGTSRGILKQKECWYIKLTDESDVRGLGEVSFIPGLSLEDPAELDIQLDHICKLINRGEMNPNQNLPSLPGVQFALETAMMDLESGGSRNLFSSDFTEGRAGIPTNGLIWMGPGDFMMEQIFEKVAAGFSVLKMKVGALDFEEEVEVLKRIRADFKSPELEIRLDANGAWSPDEARKKLEILASFKIHSIEQPIAAGQRASMAEICLNAPFPIALDEELIGIHGPEEQFALLEEIKPDYIILKPGLIGGISASEHWIKQAKKLDIGWWATSALESNIGLNAIAQWTASLNVSIPQGLGTGSLYSNNIPSPLAMESDSLWYRPEAGWDLEAFKKFKTK